MKPARVPPPPNPSGPPAERLAELKRHLAAAAAAGGHPPPCLVAVSKTHPAPAIRPLLEAGQRDFGENRVQEAAAKWPALRRDYPDVRLHLVGRLQSNKAMDAVMLFDAIHSVDRPSLVDALAAATARTGRRPTLFIQVNSGDEPQKGGVPIENLGPLFQRMAASGLDAAGLMVLPPADEEPAIHFALVAKLARAHGLALLSMGMSGDWDIAARLGATHVRIGSALFGERQPALAAQSSGAMVTLRPSSD